MKVGLYESSTGSGMHVAQLWRGLTRLGHCAERFQSGESYDVVLMFNQTPHFNGAADTDYVYPAFPDDRQRVAFIDFAEFGWKSRLPENRVRFANGLTESAMTVEEKKPGEQRKLKSWLEGRSFPYFLRELHKDIEYPANYHPIDYPLYHQSEDPREPVRAEYLRRDLELFCWWGMSHPWRVNLTEVLRGCHRKAEIGDRWSSSNMPQSLYFERTRAAKCSVSFDGYGSGSFRMTEVLVRTLLLQGPLSIRTRAELVDGQTCIAYNVVSRGEDFVSTDLPERMAEALGDPERSFEIYRNGYEHCVTHLTEKATAQYVLDVVAAHDFSKPTQLNV